MNSDGPYLQAPEIPPGCCKHGMPHKFGCDDCTIERLHAENAELRKDVDHKDAYAEQLGRDLARATAEIEALREKLKARTG